MPVPQSPTGPSSQKNHSLAAEVDKSVNLYTLLDISPTADEATVRTRINKLFLEAQSNLDHRNFRRRFYYQELFEVHLLQARLHLLDEDKRRAYDQSLNAAATPALDEGVKDSERVSSDLNRNARPTVGDEDKAERQARLRAANLAAIEAIKKSNTALQSETPETRASEESMRRFKQAQIQEAETKQTRDEQVVVTKNLNGAPPTQQLSAAQLEQLQKERRQDFKRRELIKNELIAVGWQWGVLSASSTLLLGTVFWFVMGRIVGNQSALLNLVGISACCGIALLVGRIAHREARRRTIALLSQMPYEHLMHRCAQR